MDVVLIALLGFLGLVVTGLVGPFVIARQLNRQRATEKAEEWRRADDLAARAEASAKAVVAAQSAASKVTIGKLETIHKLVNSNLTASKEATLAALEQTLALLHNVNPPDPNAVVATRAKVSVLSAELETRKQQDAEAQPGIEQTKIDEADLASLNKTRPVVVSTDPAAEGTPVVIEGTMTSPPA